MRLLSFALLAAALSAQTVPRRLTLKQAEELALKNHPRIRGSRLNALAAGQLVIQARSAYLPFLSGSLTGAGALDGSRIGAGSLNNQIIYNRLATGITIGQMITDFGRTSSLVRSSELEAQAQERNAQAARADVLLQVDRAYYAVLRAQSVLQVARQTVAARQLVADQVKALADSKLKSGLDVSFANVNLSEARLTLVSAQNDLQAAFALLSAALGYSEPQVFELADEAASPPLPARPDELIRAALRDRPELAGLRLEEGAAQRFARAERALMFPTLSAVASAGLIPSREDPLRGRYSAAGLNINLPVLNGGLFRARREAAELRAREAGENVRDLANRISRDVEVAWLNASTAQQRLQLTAEMLGQARQALELAQARYDLGLSSIVELSQAQLNQTAAEIASAGARYDYLIAMALLDYQTGALR
jgi:outer membrane protein